MNKTESEKQGQHDSFMCGICIQVYMYVYYTYPYMLHMYVGSERKMGNCKQEGSDLREERGGKERGGRSTIWKK